MKQKLDEFIGLSADLTGFDTLDLRQTGVAEEYLQALHSIVGADLVQQLLQSEPVDHLLENEIMGPLARNIIVLWYTGCWTALPDAWYGESPRFELDVGHVVSPTAYLAGLQWSVAGAHPPGGLPPGFSSWAQAPLEESL